MRGLALALLVPSGCGEAPPVPPSLHADAGATGARVRYGAVSGYLARPNDRQARRGELWTADPGASEVQLLARVRASENTLVLVVLADTPLEEARSYLSGQLPSPVDIPTCPVGKCP